MSDLSKRYPSLLFVGRILYDGRKYNQCSDWDLRSISVLCATNRWRLLDGNSCGYGRRSSTQEFTNQRISDCIGVCRQSFKTDYYIWIAKVTWIPYGVLVQMEEHFFWRVLSRRTDTNDKDYSQWLIRLHEVKETIDESSNSINDLDSNRYYYFIVIIVLYL